MADTSEPRRSIRPTPWVARVLGPLALILVIVAAAVIISSSTGGDGDTGTQTDATTQTSSSDKEGPETPRTYLVEPGDSLTSVAEAFGVSVKRLERLNPEVDAQTLNEGQELTLR